MGSKAIGRFEHQAVVVRVISREIQPAGESCCAGEIEPVCASEVGVEVVAKIRTGARESEAAAIGVGVRVAGIVRAEFKADDVVKAAGEIFGGEADAIAEEFLIEADGPGFAGFGFQRRIAEVAEVVAVDLVEARLLDAFGVEGAEESIAAECLCRRGERERLRREGRRECRNWSCLQRGLRN